MTSFPTRVVTSCPFLCLFFFNLWIVEINGLKMCVRVYVREKEREKVRVCVCVREREEREREREREREKRREEWKINIRESD